MGLLGSGIDWISAQMPDFVSQAINMASALFNALVSFVVSIYVVLDKDTFKGQFKKMLFALFPPHVVDTVVRVLKDVDRMFGGFVSGKFIDSVIIGILFFVFMKLLHIPESVLISVVMGVTNMIPTFGPFMGGIPCVIFMVFVDYRYALTLAILIIVLQQFDGNVLDPKILGDSLGISAFWVVFSVVFFGGIFGVWGMFFGVPTFAVLYKETGELIDYLLRKKRYPVSREAYAKAGFPRARWRNSRRNSLRPPKTAKAPSFFPKHIDKRAKRGYTSLRAYNFIPLSRVTEGPGPMMSGSLPRER